MEEQPLSNSHGEATVVEAEETISRQYVRIIYAKTESIKFISHHDEFRLWERTLRRADLPLLYKQGFNPQPHMQFASPLGVGITGSLSCWTSRSARALLPELHSRLEAS